MVALPSPAELSTAQLGIARDRRMQREEEVEPEAQLTSPTSVSFPVPGRGAPPQWRIAQRGRIEGDESALAAGGVAARVAMGFVPGEGFADMAGQIPVNPLDPSQGMTKSAWANFTEEEGSAVEGSFQLLGGLADGLLVAAPFAGPAAPAVGGVGVFMGGAADAMQAWRKGHSSAAEVATAMRQAGKSAQLGDMLKRAGKLDDFVSELKTASAYDDFSLAPVVRDASKLASTDVRKALSASDREGLAFDTIRRARETYTPEDGWAPLEIVGGKFEKTDDGEVVFTPKAAQPGYGFDIPPEGVSRETWEDEVAGKMVDEVSDVVSRAASGDPKARSIIAEAKWYRAMRTRLRQEFGGMGDLFADLLGATSAQTPVRKNWDNAIEILSNYSRGGYDREIAAYVQRAKAGEEMSPKTLQQLFNAGEFPLVTNAAGKMFGTNSPAATVALLGLFRDVKAGRAPKTVNFAGNLIGYSDRATVDVWAARALQRLAGRPRLAPVAEKALTGKHLPELKDRKTGGIKRPASTVNEPQIAGEFGFGQKVFAKASKAINERGVISSYDPNLGQIGEDDLQAIVWFVEKEQWAKNGWTNKAGEGGSLDYEASLAGVPDQMRVTQLRREATRSFTAPKRRQGELDEVYNIRVSEAQKRHDAGAAAAQRQLDEMAAPLDRYTMGFSGERPFEELGTHPDPNVGGVPSNFMQAEMAAEFDDVVRADRNVLAYNLTDTIGRFMKKNERSLNGEYIVNQEFNPAALIRRLIEQAKAKNQDSAFISKVLRDPSDSADARPGLEIYFKNRQGPEFAQKLSDKLTEYGIDGFTFVTDARAGDRTQEMMSGGDDVAGIVGIRMQYIPEYDDAFDAARRDEIMDEKMGLFQTVAREIAEANPDVSAANPTWYDTKIFFRDGYDEALGQPKQRDVVKRGKSGRPIQTRPLAIGTEQRIIDESLERAAAINEPGMEAWHGSPHSFTGQFKMDRLGSGEGAQAYGHGLYFAENKSIAKHYRERLSENRSRIGDDIAQDALHRHKGDKKAASKEITDLLNVVTSLRPKEGVDPDEFVMMMSEHIERYENALLAIRQGGKVKGSLYNVKIKAKPEEFLDWDKPFGEQSPQVQQAIRAFAEGEAQKANAARAQIKERILSGKWMGTRRKPEDLDKVSTPEEFTGKALYQRMQNSLGAHSQGEKAAEASEELKKLGIKGIRFLDASSRRPEDRLTVSVKGREFNNRSDDVEDIAAGHILDKLLVARGYDGFDARKDMPELLKKAIRQTTNDDVKAYLESLSPEDVRMIDRSQHNLVVFDDQLVRIMRKYAIPALIGGAAGAKTLADEDVTGDDT